MTVTQSDFMQTVLPLQRPAWWGTPENGCWMCPFCIERFANGTGIRSLTFCQGVGNTKIGYCECGYWVRFADKWGTIPRHVAGRILEFGRDLEVVT